MVRLTVRLRFHLYCRDKEFAVDTSEESFVRWFGRSPTLKEVIEFAVAKVFNFFIDPEGYEISLAQRFVAESRELVDASVTDRPIDSAHYVADVKRRPQGFAIFPVALFLGFDPFDIEDYLPYMFFGAGFLTCLVWAMLSGSSSDKSPLFFFGLAICGISWLAHYAFHKIKRLNAQHIRALRDAQFISQFNAAAQLNQAAVGLEDVD